MSRNRREPTLEAVPPAVSNGPLRVVMLATPDAQPLDVAGPYEVFSLAAKKLRDLGDESGRGYRVEILTMDKNPHITGALGLSIVANGNYSRWEGEIDTLLVVGGMEPWNPAGRKPVLDWIRLQARKARRIGGICTGAFVLAEAGLLNYRRATTHWYFCQQLAAKYPKVKVEPEPIFVADGNVYTCAGVTAGMDLALALIEQDLGSDVAVRIARAYVMFLRRSGGQSQFSTPLSFAASSQSPLNKLQVWILDHLHKPLTIEQMAERAHMSPRNFARVFRRQFHMTPGAYLDNVRVEAARKRLEETTDTIEAIAEAIGFGNASTMRRAFMRILDVTPADYRARFRSRPYKAVASD